MGTCQLPFLFVNLRLRKIAYSELIVDSVHWSHGCRGFWGYRTAFDRLTWQLLCVRCTTRWQRYFGFVKEIPPSQRFFKSKITIAREVVVCTTKVVALKRSPNSMEAMTLFRKGWLSMFKHSEFPVIYQMLNQFPIIYPKQILWDQHQMPRV